MKVKVVCFDCAETLMAVRWNPSRLATECAAACGAELPEGSQDVYSMLLQSRWAEFRDINLSGDIAAYDGFWEKLTHDWMRGSGVDSSLREAISREYDRRLWSTESDVFRVFPDTVPALERLREQGYRLAVVSNWDASLERTLVSHGLRDYFEVVAASMVVGSEKPDAGIFRHALDLMGVRPEEAAHIGDNPIADLQGARALGMRAYLIDREYPHESDVILNSFDRLPAVLA